MKDFTIAMVAHESVVGDVKGNLERTIQYVRKAKKAKADLVCLPELGITGHAGHADMVRQAEPVPDGAAPQTMVDLAKELDLHIAAGICEDDLGIHYNTQFVVGPEGYLGKQRKVHLSRDEYFYFRHGTALPVIRLPFVRMGMIICYDNGFPELSRCLAVDGAELLFAPHAARCGKEPKDAAGRRQRKKGQLANWRRMHQCRAVDNGCYVALCNMAGDSIPHVKGVDAYHAGGCMVVGPTGEVVAQSRTRDIKEEMLVVELEGEAVAAVRRRACFNLQTRRPEVFGALTRATA